MGPAAQDSALPRSKKSHRAYVGGRKHKAGKTSHKSSSKRDPVLTSDSEQDGAVEQAKTRKRTRRVVESSDEELELPLKKAAKHADPGMLEAVGAQDGRRKSILKTGRGKAHSHRVNFEDQNDATGTTAAAAASTSFSEEKAFAGINGKRAALHRDTSVTGAASVASALVSNSSSTAETKRSNGGVALAEKQSEPRKIVKDRAAAPDHGIANQDGVSASSTATLSGATHTESGAKKVTIAVPLPRESPVVLSILKQWDIETFGVDPTSDGDAGSSLDHSDTAAAKSASSTATHEAVVSMLLKSIAGVEEDNVYLEIKHSREVDNNLTHNDAAIKMMVGYREKIRDLEKLSDVFQRERDVAQDEVKKLEAQLEDQRKRTALSSTDASDK